MISLNTDMLAPCGMNCSFCYVHHKKKNPCGGCNPLNDNKPKSCRNCNIKNCITQKGLDFCYQCLDFPCHFAKKLDSSYQKRYKQSLIKNLKHIKDHGMQSLMNKHQLEFKCPECGNYINMHDRICYQCNKVI